MKANTFIDGCGVLPDTPIGDGTRIRFQLDEDRQKDISVFVEDGKLRVYGMYQQLIITFDQPNHIDIHTEMTCPTSEQRRT